MKNRVTITREEGEGHNEGKKGKGHQGTCIKDPWTEPMVGRIEGGRWRWEGQWRMVAGKWRQLYLNNNKIIKKKENIK